MKNNYSNTILLLIIMITSSATIYYYYEYKETSETNRNLLQNFEELHMDINLLINFGNGTVLYFNQTSIPIFFTMYDSTLLITNNTVDSTYYEEFDSYFVNSIFDMQGNSTHGWYAWEFKNNKWVISNNGSNNIQLSSGDTIAWYFQSFEYFDKDIPN